MVQVFAVAISANTGGPNSEFDGPEVGKRIEQAMASAVLWCYGEGITDVEIVSEKMQVARENVLRDARRELATARGLPTEVTRGGQE